MKILPAILLAAPLFAAAQSAQDQTGQTAYEGRRLRDEVTQMNRQIIANTQHLADIDRRLAEIDPVGSAGRIAALRQDFKAHEDEDKRIKADAEREHETTMRRIDLATGVTATAMLSVLGTILVSWLRGKQHRAHLIAVENKSNTNAEDIVKVSKAIAEEVRRNNAMDTAQTGQDEKIQGLEDRETRI